LAVGRPGVKFYEGKEGIIQAYEELLDNMQPIDSIEDARDMVDFIPDYVQTYVRKRVERGLPNRSIAPDTNTINDPNPDRLLDSRLLPASLFPFRMDIKISGNTVQLTTLEKNQA